MSGKKFRAAAEKVDRNKRYPIAEGFKLLKQTVEITKTKYDQTVDVAIDAGGGLLHARRIAGAVQPHRQSSKTQR